LTCGLWRGSLLPPKGPEADFYFGRSKCECLQRRMIPKSSPDVRLRFDPRALGLFEPSRAFYRRDTVRVARDLIGAWFARRYRNDWYGARIVETEAYLGAEDAAAHSWRGRRTARVEPMYADGGHLYVFLVYGMHYCANVVTREEGVAEAVLLRAAEGPTGTPVRFLSGPGRLCAALGVTVAWSGADLVKQRELRIFCSPGPKAKIGVSPRIGVDYAGEAKLWPLRFYDRNSRAVSGPASLCRYS
jgi:DNA-3-methyladenine glycosylase